jgi:hypothetical protein
MSPRKKKGRNAQAGSKGVTWAQAARDITIRLIDKGAILPGFISAAMLLLLFKLDGAAAKELVFSILNNFINLNLAGWALSVVIVVTWQVQMKSARKNFSLEAARIGKEKSALQRQLSDVNLGSSDNKRLPSSTVS